MVKTVIISEIPISMVEMKESLNALKKKDKELSFRSSKTLEYLNQFTLINKKKAEELKEELEKLNIPRLKDIHIIKILDILPKTVEELKSLLQPYTLTVTNDNLKKIVSVINKY